MLAPLLLALVLTDAADAAAPPGPDPRAGWRHDAAIGVHSTSFSSKEGSAYTFHSASLGYLGSVGATGGFLHLALLVPLEASQDGTAYATANYYGHRSGADLLAGAEHRWPVGSAELEAGPGLHATLIYLPGQAGYRDFSALPLGLGAFAIVRWKTGAERLSRSVTLSVYASLAYDLFDPAHANDLAHGVTIRLGAAIGLGARR